ncbi:FAD-dependent oxidoreductase [Oculatella sp. FACHB-28]|uniref:FAD-dependent oxidoreductase n=1 Tax=Oculatella sp. FACHB-28 TaxID=2692845 RepID=UPI001681D089|nr:FAD-dependent oxidoreductase [Oculatella sp. FACHB-28]MBD2057573.1 FAD-dependent oxidoreductase [Oculatella sp. FACHB-28]
MAYDYDLFVIGAGSGGLAAAQRAVTYGASVAIAEQSKPGGACVNHGCIPEKLLDYAAGFRNLEQVAVSYGWKESNREFDWSQFVRAEEQHVEHLNGVHLRHLQEGNIQVIQGQAHFLDAHTVTVGDRSITAEKILIAVGAKPSKPSIPGIEHTITWHQLYHLPQQPKSLAVVGGDPIGVKITGSINALGSNVTQIIPEDHILAAFDAELAQEIQEQLSKQGVQILPKTNVAKIEKTEKGLCLTLSNQSNSKQPSSLTVDAVLMDVPRKPNLAGLNLEKANIQLTEAGAISIDESSRTTQSNIFAIGDCTGRIPLTPSAIAQGRAFADAEFGGKSSSVRLDWVPISLASQPEAATVGLSESQARQKFGDAVFCYQTRFRPLLYCLAAGNEQMFVKAVVNRQDSERVLGIHIMGDRAVDIVQSLAVSLRLGVTKHDLDSAIGIHPSSAEEIFSL